MPLRTQCLLIGLTLCAVISCQPAHVIATIDKGYPPEARTHLVGETIWLEVKAPLVSGVESWQATFTDGIPDGFTTKAESRETVFSWIVPKERITWFGTSGYDMNLVSGEHTRKLNIRVINNSANVSRWVITIIPK